MAISGLDTYTSDMMSLTDYFSQSKNSDTDNSILSTSTTYAQSQLLQQSVANKRASSAYGNTGASSELGKAALQKALSELAPNGERVTFQDIAAHRQNLESEFTLQLRAALMGQGVSLDTEFALHLSSDGQVSVECNDAVAKERILAYLEDNPEMCEQFGYIQALANLERARQSPGASALISSEVRESKASIQAKAMEIFFDGAMNSGMNYSSIMAAFSPASSAESDSSASFYAGIDFTV